MTESSHDMARPLNNIRNGFDEKDPKRKCTQWLYNFFQTKKKAAKLVVSQNQEKYSFY
jgi:hypothetical protein